MTSRLRPVHGVALLFLANGLTAPALWPRFPEIRAAVDATSATFGLALVGTGVGGVLGSVLAPRVVRWLGVGRAATVTAVLLAAATVTVGLAPSVAALFAAFALIGLIDGVADISQNAAMFDVQRTGDRSVASRMHAVWSVGALLGTGLGTVAAAARVSVLAQTLALAVVGTGLVLAARRPVLRVASATSTSRSTSPTSPGVAGAAAAGPTPADIDGLAGPGGDGQRRGGHRKRVWALVVVTGLVVAAIEGIANEWSALTLRDGLGTSLAVAGLGPTAYAGAMLVGRLVGDRAIDRFGARSVARAGALAVVVGGGLGLAVAAWLDLPAVLLAGLVVAGIGSATLFPLMLAAGDRLDATGRGVAAGSLGARAGFLAVPLLVGGAGDRYGMLVAFALLPIAGAVAAVALPRALRGS